MSASDVDTELRTLRASLNDGIFINNIQRHGFEWKMACASMDMIEDAQLAIDAFGRKPVSDGQRSDVYGQRYLEVYGLFQAFYIQQDAIRDLAAALKLSKINPFKDPDFSIVRDWRNRYFGHPSKHDPSKHEREKTTTYHGLTRVTVTSDEITGWTRGPRFSTETISINASIEKQADGAVRLLRQLQQELEAKRTDYIMKFDGKELPTDHHVYEFEKLYMWAIQPEADGAVLADFAQEIVAKTLKEMKAGIEERYAESFGVDPIRTIEKAEICLEHMRKSISRGTGSDSFEDEIYMDALRKAYDEIVEACIAINQVFKMADN